MSKGYTVNGTRTIASIGIEALEAIVAHCASLGEDAEVAEIDIRENAPITAIIAVGTSTNWNFVTYTWTREAWVEV